MTETAGTAPLDRIPSGPQDLWSYLNGGMLLRAALVASILGSALTLANQAGAVFGPETIRLLPLSLVYLTPFVVVTISQLLGTRQAVAEVRRGGARRPAAETFGTTALSHGIPSRAAGLGLLAGSLNTAIVTTAAFLEQGNLNALPLPLLAQAFSLPLVFGALSQALAYRRAAKAFASR